MREIIAKVDNSVFDELIRLRKRYKAKNWAALLQILILRDKGMKVI